MLKGGDFATSLFQCLWPLHGVYSATVFSPSLITYENLQAQWGLNDLRTATQEAGSSKRSRIQNLDLYVLIKGSSFGSIPYVRIALQKYLITWQLPQPLLFDRRWLCTLLQDKKSNQSMLYLCSLAHTGITSSISAFMASIIIECEHLISFNVHVLQQSSEVW